MSNRKAWAALMFVAALALSAASFYTTYTGMVQYMDKLWVAGLITFGLQAIMFAMAWILLQMLGTGARRVMFGLSIFFVCAVISVFFSFASLFDTIYSTEARDITNGSFVRAFEAKVDVRVQEAMTTEIQTRHQEIIASPEFIGWLADLETVAKVALQASQDLGDRAASSGRALEAELAALAGQKSGLESSLAAARNQIDVLEQSLSAGRDQSEARRDRLAALRAEADVLRLGITEKQAEMDAEETGLGANAGRGPTWRRLEGERDAIQRRLNLVEVQIEALSTQATDIGAQVGDVQAELAQLEQIAAQTEGEIAALASQIEMREQRIAALGNGVQFDPEQLVKTMRDESGAVSVTPAEAEVRFNNAVQACLPLVAEIRAIDTLSGTLNGADCVSPQLQGEINGLGSRIRALAGFTESCRAAAQAPSVLAAETRMAASLARSEICVNAAPLSVEQVGLLSDELARLRTERGPNAHPFVTAQNALFADRIPLAYFALIIAIVIDLLILLTALLAHFVRRSKREIALNNLLQIESEERTGKTYVTLNRSDPFFTAMDEEARALQMNQLGQYMPNHEDGPRLYVFKGALDYLRNEIAREGGLA